MSKKKTTEQFIQEAKLVHGDKYDYSFVKYEGSKIKINILCKKHNVLFAQRPNDHLNGHGCFLCAREEIAKSKSLTKEQFIEKSEKKYGNKFDYSKIEYKNERTKVIIICPKHGQKNITPVYHLISPKGCPDCGFENKKTSIDNLFKRLSSIKEMSFSNIQISEKHSSEYLVTGTCKICGNTITKTIHYFLYDFNGCQCQKPNDFFGEFKTKEFLLKNNIALVRNKTFPELRDIRELSYDFFLPEKNILIEIQGEQHTKPKNFGGISKEEALKNFKIQQKHDKMKRDFAKKKEIKLIEISYKDFSKIDEILKEKIFDKK